MAFAPRTVRVGLSVFIWPDYLGDVLGLNEAAGTYAKTYFNIRPGTSGVDV